MRSPRPPRRRRTRSATCRSASSASLVICTILYVIVATVLTGMVSYKELNVAAPVALALDKYPRLHWLGYPGEARRDRRHDLGDAGDDAGAGAHLLRDGARRPAAASSSARCTRSSARPPPARWSPACTAAIIGGLFPVGVLGRAGLDRHAGRLRYRLHRRAGAAASTRPDLPRPFRAPLPWFTCILGALVCGRHDGVARRRHLVRLIVWTVHRGRDLRRSTAATTAARAPRQAACSLRLSGSPLVLAAAQRGC